MLDRLIETTDDGIKTRKMRKILMGIGSLMTALFVCGLIFSIFSTNLAMGSESIELTSLVAPAIPDVAPPPPENQPKPENSKSNSASRLPIRVVNMQRPDETPVRPPKSVSTTANRYRARPRGAFVLNPNGRDENGTSIGRPGIKRPSSSSSSGFAKTIKPTRTEKPRDAKTPVPPPPQIKKKPDIIKYIGVANGKAIRLVKPAVTNVVRMSGARGSVRVNVLISKTGKVLSAKAMNGHPLLKPLATSAALRSSFSPTKLNNIPIKVRGVIVYNFK